MVHGLLDCGLVMVVLDALELVLYVGLNAVVSQRCRTQVDLC